MDEMLLNELYGNVTTQDEEQVKLAQAEFIEQAAQEAGVDINSLTDEELAKFAEYVLEQGSEPESNNVSNLTEDQFIEADQMGRVMAQAYADETIKIASILNEEGNEMNDLEYLVTLAMEDVAQAWDEELDGEGFNKLASSEIAYEFLEAGEPALAYVQMLDSFEFAKEAELRASELLLANGIDPVTLEDCEPEYVKLASFPEIEDASSEYSAEVLAEYNNKLDIAADYIVETLLTGIFG